MVGVETRRVDRAGSGVREMRFLESPPKNKNKFSIKPSALLVNSSWSAGGQAAADLCVGVAQSTQFSRGGLFRIPTEDEEVMRECER